MRDHTDVGFKLCASCRGWFVFTGELCRTCKRLRRSGDSAGLIERRSQLFRVHSWAWFHLHRDDDSPAPVTATLTTEECGEIDERINRPAGQGELFHG